MRQDLDTQAGQLRVRGVDSGQLFECAENTPCPGLAEHGSQNWAPVMTVIEDPSYQHGSHRKLGILPARVEIVLGHDIFRR